MLAGSIRRAVEIFLERKPNANRVIIHFYKEISERLESNSGLESMQRHLSELREREKDLNSQIGQLQRDNLELGTLNR